MKKTKRLLPLSLGSSLFDRGDRLRRFHGCGGCGYISLIIVGGYNKCPYPFRTPIVLTLWGVTDGAGRGHSHSIPEQALP